MYSISRLLLLPSLLAALIPLSAGAVPYQGNTIYRSTYQGKNYLILSGTPSDTIDYFSPTPRDSYRYQGADACGWAKITLPPVTVGNFAVNGAATNPYTATATTVSYNCNRNSEESNLSGASAYNSITREYYWKGSPRQAVTFTYTQPSPRRSRLNGCGFVQILIPSATGSFILGSTTYNIANLPVAPNPPLCRQIGNTSVPYVPPSY